ncbi:hypothetical protein F5B17DRAFT_250237 [Nemania serpens]|nr:hypothetical protein F5B17DRAFT_250237 [Nemania serpens]
MPPHLHPRSRMTSSLFAITVAASFLVVGLPHILPCPAPRVAYADADADSPDSNRRRVRRRSPQQAAEVKDGIAQFGGASSPGRDTSGGAQTSVMTSTAPREKRECPVPKPGVISELMGFKKEERCSTGRPRSEDLAEKTQTSRDE